MIGKLMLRCQAAVLLVAVIAPISLAQEGVLLIPDVLTETVGKYDARTGFYQGILIPDDGRVEEVHCVVTGPDGLLYVADKFHGKIFRYDMNGSFVDTFVDTTLNGLWTPFGMDFMLDPTDGSYSLIVALQEIFAPGETPVGRIARYLADGTYDADFLGAPRFNSVIFDVMVDNDNSLWYAQIGIGNLFGGGGVGRFDPSGQDLGIILPVRYPNQVIRCPSGNLMASVLAGYFVGEPMFHEFETNGNVIASWDIGGVLPAPHGIAKLENGMLLCVGDSGVWRVDPARGYTASLVRSGSGFRMIHRLGFTFPPPPPPPPPACTADVNSDGVVGIDDFLAVLTEWGMCGILCPADGTNDGFVGIEDFLAVLAAWGPCP